MGGNHHDPKPEFKASGTDCSGLLHCSKRPSRWFQRRARSLAYMGFCGDVHGSPHCRNQPGPSVVCSSASRSGRGSAPAATASRGSALKPGRAVWLREASANLPACAPRPLRNHAQHGGTKAVFEMTYAGRLAMFAIRVSYPGGHSVWLTRRFPTVAWGLKKDALPFPTEADAARTIARLRPSGPVSIEPIAPEIAKPA